MKLLIIHQNFPGQFRHVAQAWSGRSGWEVLGMGRDTAPGLPGVRCVRYALHRSPGPGQHPYLRAMENAVLHGQAVARLLQRLKARGFVPDVILAHPGWGETLYAKDVFPRARLVHFCEWYYRGEGADLGFDPEHPGTLDDRLRVHTWNALHLLNLESCDVGVTPTRWQHSQHPAAYGGKIAVAHEGIDTARLTPDPHARFVLPGGTRPGLVLEAGQPVVTYVARNLEPYRGFHRFMRALERVQAEHPTCHALILGGDDTSYGRKPEGAANWREQLMREVALDPARTHFLGKLPYQEYLKVLQVSAAHVYLTYPFVLSWSMLEAMACGCLVIGSDTAPVREVLRDGENGWLVDFFDEQGLANRIVEGLRHPDRALALRERARACAGRYSRQNGLMLYDELIGRGRPRETCAAISGGDARPASPDATTAKRS